MFYYLHEQIRIKITYSLLIFLEYKFGPEPLVMTFGPSDCLAKAGCLEPAVMTL